MEYNSHTLNPVEEVYPIVNEQLSQEQFIQIVRSERNKKLNATDWAVLPDSPLSDEKKQQYQNYRQALRDLPQTLSTVEDLVWPVQPE